MSYDIYLSGEIHTDWREQIRQGIIDRQLDIKLSGPVTNHERSDNIGEKILGTEQSPFWKDHKAAKINAIRSSVLIRRADIVIVRFGEQYKQWNAAFDAGLAIGLDKPLIVMHAPELTHPLKEIDAAALAVVETPRQAVEILQYISDDPGNT